jgi:hypothetical protein
MLLSLSTVSIAFAAQQMGPDYDSTWSPDSLESVVTQIQLYSRPQDEVMSGAVIWEFESGRKPFMNLTHPLSYLEALPTELHSQLVNRLLQRPPKVVVLDGYTEKTFLKHLQELPPLLNSHYEHVSQILGSRAPINVYIKRNINEPVPITQRDKAPKATSVRAAGRLAHK